MQNIIFYFTGTGNSLMLAERIKEELGECDLYNITQFDTAVKAEAERIGFVFPVYFWGAPHIVKKFIEEVRLPKKAYLFAAASIGSSSGNALSQINEELSKKGLKLSAGYSVLMPDNYIIVHGAPSAEAQNKLFDKASEKIHTIVSEIRANQENELPKPSKILGKINQFYSKKTGSRDLHFTVNDNCVSCGMCMRECPAKNILMAKGKPCWNHQCEFCLRCIQICPKEAINYGKKTINRKRYINPYTKMKVNQ